MFSRRDLITSAKKGGNMQKPTLLDRLAEWLIATWPRKTIVIVSLIGVMTWVLILNL